MIEKLRFDYTWSTENRYIKRLQPLDLDYLKAVSETLSEWASPEDEEVYRDS